MNGPVKSESEHVWCVSAHAMRLESEDSLWALVLTDSASLKSSPKYGPSPSVESVGTGRGAGGFLKPLKQNQAIQLTAF